MMIQVIDQFYKAQAEALGATTGQLRLMTCLFLSYPLCAVLKRIPAERKAMKQFFIIGVAAVYIFVILSLGTGMRTLLLSSSFTYIVTRYYKSPFMPWVNLIGLMTHLACNHFSAQIFPQDYDPNEIDITGTQMVLVMNLSAYGWSIYDGRQPDSSLSDFQRDRAIRKFPSILDYTAYVLFFPAFLIGPAIEYNDFERWLTLELFKDIKTKNKSLKIPPSHGPAMWKLLQGLLWTYAYLNSSFIASLDFAMSDDFRRTSFVYRIFYLWALGFVYRFKYYGAWSISEGACILSGIGYNGVDPKTGKLKWDRVRNIDIIGFETGQNCHACLEAWNKNTNKWLKNYVYLRITPKGKKPGFRSTLITFIISAFWHGTRPGYYMSFATGALIQTCGRYYRRHIRPIFMSPDKVTPLPSKKYYDVLSYIVTQLAFGYLVQPFVILDLVPSLRLLASVYFYCHLLIGITIFLFAGPYKKSVLAFLESWYPQDQTTSVSSKSIKSHKLAEVLKQKEDYELDEQVLGVPAPDFEDLTLQEVVDDLDDARQAVQNWRERKGSVIEEENIKEALKKLREDIRSVLPESGFTQEREKTE